MSIVIPLLLLLLCQQCQCFTGDVKGLKRRAEYKSTLPHSARRGGSYDYIYFYVNDVSVAQGHVWGVLKKGRKTTLSTLLPHSCAPSYDCAFQDPLYGCSPWPSQPLTNVLLLLWLAIKSFSYSLRLSVNIEVLK